MHAKTSFEALNVGDRVLYLVESDANDEYHRGTVVQKEIDTFVIVKLDDGRVERVESIFCSNDPVLKILWCVIARKRRRGEK